jgi:hypothetical protein
MLHMGYLLDQMEKVAYFTKAAMMEKIALEASQDNNAARVVNGVAGALGVGAAGGLTAMLPSQLETLRSNALAPQRATWAGLAQKGSDARRFLAQEKSLLRNAHKAMDAGDGAKWADLAKKLNSPAHRAWRGFKAMSLPGKFKLLAPVLGTATGAVGLGTAGIYGVNKAING